MPRFPVAFGRRKSTADNLENAPVEPSFRVLERSEVAGGKSFDGGVRLAAARTHTLPNLPNPRRPDLDDNIFADLKPNRGSGSSNTTKTNSTDNSSRHSNASTAPSSADLTGVTGQEEWRNGQRKIPNDIPVPPIPKTSSNGFLKAAGRTFSFGGQKKQLPPVPAAKESPPPSPVVVPEPHQTPSARSRATTTSTSTTLTPPRLESEFNMDLGGDFGRMLLGNEKRASMMTLKEDPESRNALAPRSLTGNRLNQPSPIQINHNAKVEASPYSWSSHHSHEQLLASTSPTLGSPNNENEPPPVPRHSSPLAPKQSSLTPSPELVARKPLSASPEADQAEGEDEEARLLKDSLSTVNRFMSGGKSSGPPSSSRYRRNDDTFDEHKGDNDSLFDSSHGYSYKAASRFARKPAPQPQTNKVMTHAEFEKYQKDKERQEKERQQDTFSSRSKADDDDEEDNYEDDDDDLEKAKQQAKQRRKQEAHMAVYRQQMMKVTGEAAGENPSRPSLQISFSTPNLPVLGPNQGPSPVGNGPSDNSDEDEEVPLAILAAHGFPSKNRPPTRLSTMMSNPNLRASQQPSYQRPVSAMPDVPPVAANPRLPAFARNLPQDPFVGAGLVRNSARESFALGGGSPAPGQMAPAPPGGLIGVIANEERSRALRRGSPHLENPNAIPGGPAFDPITGIPPQMMYQNNPNRGMLTPGEQAQVQMSQQMQQFMQMQMQFMQMQMMAAQNGNAAPGANVAATQSMTNLTNMNGLGGMGGPGMGPMLGAGLPNMGGSDMYRHSFMGNDSSLDLSARGDAHMRTMSLVQPSSASWIQPPPPQKIGFAPSIHIQGAGYAPSIAPSERSNIGLPGRYRPVSQAPPPHPTGPSHLRTSSTMSGGLKPANEASKSGNTSDDDDEQGWAAMKAKREKKKSIWKSKKTLGDDLSAFIN
ncbi:hypothetical protein V8F06_001011 [Rhypophila decipiens]